MIIDGKAIAKKIENQIKREVTKLKKKNVFPKLAIVYASDDKASKTYIKKKKQACERTGIDFELFQFDKNIIENKLIENIKNIQNNKKISGLVLQLPLAKKLDTAKIINTINPDIDVDCLTDHHLGNIVMKTDYMLPPTPEAVLTILKELKINLKEKNIVIVGAGALVGKPLSIILLNKQATITVCNEYTQNLKEKTKKADILISAVGKRKLITADMVKKGAIVIDTGICFENKKMYGDVDFEKVNKKASYITPTPGGVGPITVSLLLKNVITCTKRINKKN
ncbi:MAG: tetrahydrofolate dehydrogenase/cyclohydrolase catalytic domain-containing protein [Patescibacteria group bacterium]